MHKNIVIFEVEGGSDKTINGHRKDTLPIVEALRSRWWDAEVIFYRPEWAEEIHAYAAAKFDGYISRVNPGSIPGGEQGYFDLLRGLSDRGLVAMSHPDDMTTFGAKDALVKLSDTGLVPDDTYAYYDIQTFRTVFPQSISRGERVLKQNRGSIGSGIWRVVVIDERPYTVGDTLPGDTQLRCTEAVDNHTEEFTLDEFMSFCEQYIVGDNGLIVDMRFLPRIVEGEIRILMVGSDPVFVVHKKPAQTEGAFSATLFSGATYTYDSPEKWSSLVELFRSQFDSIRQRLNVRSVPLIWTADFMLDHAPDAHGATTDTYVLGEFNCSCVGFTSHLDIGIQDAVAAEVIHRIEAADAIRSAERAVAAAERSIGA